MFRICHCQLLNSAAITIFRWLCSHPTPLIESSSWMFYFLGFKTFYTQACDNFMLFGTAYFRVATVANAVKGFKICGIEPYNPQIFAEEDFAPSATTE
ncbi:hypothetical protein PR048_008906 [Dryococelus australis]|uniref:Uncharacterized protein n=1 Tax=Dryococelus australis TaxID=614101 RepID=A0ABQ9HYF7_9NEOP|nr:hypothetical protein PR048_008906 [Dryococelus australis]